MVGLLVISPVGIYKVMKPFRLVVKSNDIWEAGSILIATEVRFHPDNLIIFKISGKWYSYRHFRILL
jgi:hypothetical protein